MSGSVSALGAIATSFFVCPVRRRLYRRQNGRLSLVETLVEFTGIGSSNGAVGFGCREITRDVVASVYVTVASMILSPHD